MDQGHKKLIVSEWILDEQKAAFPDVVLSRLRTMDRRVLWAIRQGPYCLNKDAEWEYEPIPSERTDDFLARCRWGTAYKALEFWRKHGQPIKWNGEA